MKFYLSSCKFGRESEKLKSMLASGSRIAHINNARDWKDADPEKRIKYEIEEIEQLNGLGFQAEPLDLRNYFKKEQELREKLTEIGGVWISGGNTFVLRQAMRLSGFDRIFNDLRNRNNFLYAGYSAGICVLCDSLKYIQQVDKPHEFPYEDNTEVIWEGLNVFNYGILPHYRSDHFESKMIEREVDVCIEKKWLFKALKDGEVLIIDDEKETCSKQGSGEEGVIHSHFIS